MPKLTKRLVDANRARRAGDYFLWDDGDGSVKGFGLRVWPTGRKQFVFQYRVGGRGGRTHRVRIGDYGPLTLDQARSRARELHGDVHAARLGDGARDPNARRRAARAAVHAAGAAPTVTDLARLFLADRKRRAKLQTLREYKRLTEREILPTVGHKKVADVVRADIARLMASMEDRPAIANNVHSLLRAMFTFAEDQELREGRNPCARVTRYPTRSPKVSLTRDQYAALGAALVRAEREGLPVPPALKKLAHGTSRARRAKATGRKRGPYKQRENVAIVTPANPYGVAVLRFLALSGWREGEALSLKRDVIDSDRGVAILQDTKTGRSVRPLGAAALTVLRAVLEQSGNPYVFPGQKPGDHLQEIKRLWTAARHAADLRARLHDLRHSFTTVGRELGYSDYVIAKLVGHVLEGMTARYGDVPDETVKQAADRIAETIVNRLDGRLASVKSFAPRVTDT